MADTNMPDGTVIITTAIDDTGIVKGFKEIADILKDIKKSVDTFGKEITDALSKISVVSVTNKFDDMEKGVKKTTNSTKKSIQELELELKELDKAQAELESSLIPTGLENVATDEQIQDILRQSKAWQKLKTDIEKVEEQLTKLKTKQATVEVAPMDVSIDPKEKTDLIDLENAIDDVGKKATKTDEELKPLPKEIEEVGDQAKKTSIKVSGFSSVLKASISTVNKFGISLLKIVGSGVLKGVKSIGNLGKSFDGLTKSMGRSVKMMGTIIIYSALFSALGKITEVTRIMLLYNDQFNQSLAQIKGNLMTAFMPIYNAVMPALNTLMSGLVLVTGYLAQFTNLIFGTSIKSSQDQAKAMYDQAFATEKTEKAQKKLNNQLAKYDELNVIQKNMASSPTAADKDVPVVPTFDTIKTTDNVNKLLELIDRVKKAWKDADFTTIGIDLGQSLNNALEKIDWDKIQSFSDRLAKSFATLGNGIIIGTDWNLVGKSVAEGLNTVTGFIETFINTFDWNALGISIGETFMGLFTNIDWDNISNSVSDGINGVIDVVKGINQTIDFKQIGNQLATSINNIFTNVDFGEASKQLSTALVGILKTVSTFISEIDWDKIGQDIAYFLLGVNWGGIILEVVKALFNITVASYEIIDGFGKGIANAIIKVGEDFYKYFQNVGKNAYEGFKKTFTKENFLKIMNTVIEAIKKSFEGAPIWFKAIANMMIKGLKDNFNWSKISENFTNFIASLRKKFENAKSWFESIGKNMLNGIKSSFTWGNIVDSITKFIESLKNKFNSAKSWFLSIGKGMVDNLKSAFKTDNIKNAILKPFTNVVNSIISLFNSMIRAINKALKISWGDIKIAGKTIVDKGSVTIANIPQIPKLAQGTYIPPNFGEFMAVLGDNKTQGEFVTPEDKLLNAFNKALDQRDGQEINLYVDGEKWFTWLMKKGRNYKNQTGRMAF